MNPDSARAPGAPADPWNDEDSGGEPAFKPLTREEAQDLRARLPVVSPWSLVGWQALSGLVMVALWGAATLDSGKAVSALLGAGAVVVPGALMAFGMTRHSARQARTAVQAFVVWELIKILTAVAILVAAAVWVPALSWTAMLTTLVVCLKTNWLVLFRQGRIRK